DKIHKKVKSEKHYAFFKEKRTPKTFMNKGLESFFASKSDKDERLYTYIYLQATSSFIRSINHTIYITV
ncbi:MAG: hypothetical protein PHS45_02415, partial [Bacilli bacterium]|nr:hypothetical protein [Bacilli bacterium]